MFDYCNKLKIENIKNINNKIKQVFDNRKVDYSEDDED